MNYPNSIKTLIECFKKLPGIGEKTAERLALASMKLDKEIIEEFSKSLIEVKSKIKKCVICNNLTEKEKCDICLNEKRNNGILCIIEDAKNIISLEKTGKYLGKYHVLDGLMSPLDGIGPDELNINLLRNRIERENINEIIFALKPSIEGETTILYISKMLNDSNIKITRIAQGIPVGADMEYIDSLTLETAINNRTEVS